MNNELAQTIADLKAGKTILYPTDTVWGLGCDATNSEAVSKIFKLKKREESKSLVILVSSVEMLQKHVKEVPKQVLELLKNSEKPTTIIYSNPQGLAFNTIASDSTIAIRIPKHTFCTELIKEFGKPIVSTSANVSGEPTPKSFSEITQPILDGADYVVNLERQKITEKSSRILRVTVDGIEVIRA
jgi:L-threonylcarbamoyladenylate synthase